MLKKKWKKKRRKKWKMNTGCIQNLKFTIRMNGAQQSILLQLIDLLSTVVVEVFFYFIFGILDFNSNWQDILIGIRSLHSNEIAYVTREFI